ncbi:MAG TPA: hypothetical protein VE995_00590 [Gaiellaceae bacterium]|nr:hypothetical protein [Gaiellaceae bacterium]
MTTLAPHAPSGDEARAAAALRGESAFYDLVALGLSVYARARFRIRVLGAPVERRAGMLYVSTHRSDDDVPLLVAALYGRVHELPRHGPAVHFVVRDDLFEPGFFAGYPSGLPRLARRLLWRVSVGAILRRHLPCHPAAWPNGMRLVQLLRGCPDTPLEELLPEPLLAPLRARAAELGEAPRLARDVLRGEYADLLWRLTSREEADEPAAQAWWRSRREAAIRDFQELVDVLRAGRSLFICPEGIPSADGTIGPLMGGVSGLAKRGEPEALVPLAPAYDPLVRGRPRAYVGVGAPTDPQLEVEETLALLRRTTPLTVGSSLAAALADGADPEERLARDVERARAEGRPHEPELADPGVRRERLAEARSAAAGRDLTRLVNEYRSARA